MSQKNKVLFAVCGLLALFVVGLAIRIAVLNAQVAFYGRPLPFTLESALEYRVVKMLFDRGYLPARDNAVQVPDGVSVRETYTVGAEYVYALLARAFPGSYPLPDRIRWISAGWFCLGIPLLSLWLWWWLRSLWAAGIGGAYYAVSLASVMRSTGQELSHENFALPLLIGHLAMSALADSRARGGMFWGAALLSAVLLGCAVATWDLIQFYVLLWAALGFARFVAGGYFREAHHRITWFMSLAALVAVAALNPYLRAHAFVTSYAMLLAYGTGLGIVVEQCLIRTRNAEGGTRNTQHRTRNSELRAPNSALRIPLVKAGLALMPLVLGIILFRTYEETYGHFIELLWAKLRFLNHKPSDPSLLTFSQRILWTPALNSVNLRLTSVLFPVILPLLFLTFLVILLDAPWRSDPGIVHVVFCGMVSLPAFVLFMRFHVFLVIFGAALLGWMGCWARTRRNIICFSGTGGFARGIRWAVIVLLLCGISAEAAHVLYRPVRWGRGLAYLAEQEELVRWMRDNTEEEPVLANFGLSAFLLTYAGCPIVLHPEFESPEIRRRVKAYGEALFRSNEAEFRAWADRYGAKYYVYALGEFSPVHPELQMRYFVNALHPPPDAAARLFERDPDGARCFTYLWGNRKYRVFRIIGRSDEQTAARYALTARQDLSRGDLDSAENKATLSLLYNPNDEQAMEVLLHVAALRDKGIR